MKGYYDDLHKEGSRVRQLESDNAVMREALETALAFTKNHVATGELWFAERDATRVVIEDALSTTASSDYAKRIEALERVAEAAKAYIGCIGGFHITRDKLVDALVELEAMKK